MKWRYHDGGRIDAGFRGKTGDCVCRALAIATGKPYQEVYDALNALATSEKITKRKRKISDSRLGVFRTTYQKYLESLGWKWTPTMQIGSGCKVHMRADELPSGRLVVSLSRHLSAVIDGEVYDTSDPTRRGTRCVYGYYKKGWTFGIVS